MPKRKAAGRNEALTKSHCFLHDNGKEDGGSNSGSLISVKSMIKKPVKEKSKKKAQLPLQCHSLRARKSIQWPEDGKSTLHSQPKCSDEPVSDKPAMILTPLMSRCQMLDSLQRATAIRFTPDLSIEVSRSSIVIEACNLPEMSLSLCSFTRLRKRVFHKH